jgi:hypothetical protein
MKKKDLVFKEFVRQLSDDDIRYVCFRLTERKSGDVGEVVEYLQQFPEIDRLFAAAKDADGLYDLIDEVFNHMDKEWKLRSYPST